VFNENNGKFEFMDFERDHQKMSTLFEHFIYNYFKRCKTDWKIRREEISWSITNDFGGEDYLPKMKTDMVLERPDRKIIIDAKFYHAPLISSGIGYALKYRSTNLYQLNTYLTHLANSKSHPCNANAEGMLLYPVLQPIPRLDVEMLGHRIRVESIDLNQGWRAIGEGLEGLVG
jgi:5-methylcytosine-specific restriction enzyme subunit McrC